MRSLVIAAFVLLAACGRSPASPSGPASPPPVPTAAADFSGYWGGTFRYSACLGLHCSGRIERTDPFSLRFRQNGSRVSGLFASSGSGVEISGDVQADGSLTLAGSEATGGARGIPDTSTFTSPLLRLDPVCGLRGAIHLEIDS